MMRLGRLALISGALVACRVGYQPISDSFGNGGSLNGGGTGALAGDGNFGGDLASAGVSGSLGAAGQASAGTSSAGDTATGGTLDTGGVSGALGVGGDAATGGSSSGTGGTGATSGASGAGGKGGTAGAGGTGGASGTAGAGGTSGASGTGGSGPCVPDGAEVCDGRDNDCNGTADDGGVCLAGCQGETYLSHRYTFCTNRLTWQAAEADCNAQGLLLVRFDDAAELAWAKGIAFASDGTNNSSSIWRWIGANDLAVNGEWRWADGTQFWQGSQTGGPVAGLFSSWAAGQPDSKDSCGQMQNNSTVSFWSVLPCTLTSPYVCEQFP